MFMQNGVIPPQRIKEMIEHGLISAAEPIQDAQFQPSSIDLRLSGRGWRVPASFLLPNNTSVSERLEEYKKDYYQFDFDESTFLEAKKTYVFEIMEELNLPNTIRARSNPKSSTGRVDTFARLITDGCKNFDNIPYGYKGKLYVVLFPMSFDLVVAKGLCLNQIRFFNHDPSQLQTYQLKDLHQEVGIIYDANGEQIPLHKTHIDEHGVFLSIDLSQDIVGYKSKKNSKPINLTKINHYDQKDFWEPIPRPKNNRLILDPDFFYILKSKERIRIPTGFACEMVDFHSGIGEFRTHYAGFFDPGFGFGKAGEVTGRHAVLEVRMRDTPMEIEDGQTFVKMIFEKMAEIPEIAYGVEVKSNYQNQLLKLSKHFKQEEGVNQLDSGFDQEEEFLQN